MNKRSQIHNGQNNSNERTLKLKKKGPQDKHENYENIVENVI